MAQPLVIELYDVRRAEWRKFTVVPPVKYEPVCGCGLHQFAPFAAVCACGVITR